MPVHTVKQGDCISTMADQYGFFWDTLWNHPSNAQLKAQRKDPAVLLPGDRVFIPEMRPKEEAGGTGTVHTFRLKGVPVKLRLRILDHEGRPRTGVKYTLEVDKQKFQGATDGDGLICHGIPPRARSGKVALETGEEYDLDLGCLNPVEFTTGVQARLSNLGYYQGEATGTLDDDTRDALHRFQKAQGLPETGEADQQTKDALLAAHAS